MSGSMVIVLFDPCSLRITYEHVAGEEHDYRQYNDEEQDYR